MYGTVRLRGGLWREVREMAFMTNHGRQPKPSEAWATGARQRPPIKTHQPLAPAFVGTLAGLAGLGFALAAHIMRLGTGGLGARELLEVPWIDLLGAKIAFWYGLAIQGGAVAIGGSLAVWQWRALRRRAAGRAGGGNLSAPRATFLRTLERVIAGADDRPYSLILFDIDGFRILNDRHGAETADALLADVGRQLASALPRGARMARFGSDEFLVFVPSMDIGEALLLARAALDRVARDPSAVGGRPLGVTLTAGAASFPETSQNLRDAISQATSALQEAKDQGRDTVIAARPNKIGLCRLGAEVESALGDHRVHAAYQPIVNLQTGQPVAEEGLARIVLPHGQVLGADQFMGAATDLRLVSRIDQALIDQALERCRVQSLQGDRRLRFINVSAALLQERQLLARVASAFSGCDVLGELTGSRNPLVVEITERELLRDPAAALQALQPLLDIGTRLAIDDFGSGYSSFLYLTTLPISFLKIEMELLKAARTSGRARSILKGIQGIAKELNILTIAEGIEDEELAGIARDHGVDWAQGFYFGRPALEGPAAARARR